jgi:DNA-binding MarR family transcriptional regulator
MDKVEEILSQWRQERPDLDVTPMGTVGRVSRVANMFAASMAANYAKYGLNAAAFDVLATLRRAGEPYCRSIGEMMEWMMISSGSTTNRLQRLEAAGLIERIVDKDDARKASVRLTSTGLDKINQVLDDHVATQTMLINCLSDNERITFEEILRKIEMTIQQRRVDCGEQS